MKIDFTGKNLKVDLPVKMLQNAEIYQEAACLIKVFPNVWEIKKEENAENKI